jgi:hypothetical protein
LENAGDPSWFSVVEVQPGQLGAAPGTSLAAPARHENARCDALGLRFRIV